MADSAAGGTGSRPISMRVSSADSEGSARNIAPNSVSLSEAREAIRRKDIRRTDEVERRLETRSEHDHVRFERRPIAQYERLTVLADPRSPHSTDDVDLACCDERVERGGTHRGATAEIERTAECVTKRHSVSQTVIAEEEDEEDVQVMQIRCSSKRRVRRDAEEGILHAKSQVAIMTPHNGVSSAFTYSIATVIGVWRLTDFFCVPPISVLLNHAPNPVW